MDFGTILPWAAFAAVMAGAWAVYSMFSASQTRASERLDEIRDPTLRARERDEKQAGSGGMQAMLTKAAPGMSKILQPKTELEQNELKIRLAIGGFNSPAAPQIFLAIKVAAFVTGALLGGGYGMLKHGMTQHGLTSLIIGAGLGFYLPEIVLRLRMRSRKEKIFLSLPDALDLMVVCVEAGLGLDAAMRRVTEELEDAHPELCGEFQLANLQLQMGRPKREVLHDLGVRTGVDDMRALVAILIQADKFGSSVAQALRVQSDSMRTKRRQMAEEKAQQTAVKMIFPLVLFIFPGIFVVLVGPAAIMMINGLLSK
ncbi:MAG TPA: type II secretion system F family protein [Planctomycetaceae bacterium]|nr:type II secretion system F family protein [Planctomycetaceae bacterium]